MDLPVNQIVCGDARLIADWPPDSIDMVMTSPPYWGMRVYGGDEVKAIWGGDKNCEHNFGDWLNKEKLIKEHKIYSDEWQRPSRKEFESVSSKKKCPVCSKEFDAKPHQQLCSLKCLNTLSNENRTKATAKNQFCSRCGAWYGQLGLEPTFELYIEHILIITALIKRVLKPSGHFYLNMGDTYGSGSGADKREGIKQATNIGTIPKKALRGYQKCLVGIPWRLALAMIDRQGWILRNSIIWNKPNAMPSSVKDRLANTYEFIFHFVKNRKYWYDLDAIREAPKWDEVWSRKGASENTPYAINNPRKRWGVTRAEKHTKIPKDQAEMFGSPRARYHRYTSDYVAPIGPKMGIDRDRQEWCSRTPNWSNISGKNPGDVFFDPGDFWTIPTQQCPEAHFATFPSAICKPPILSSCPLEICKKCGLPRVRVTERANPDFDINKSEVGKIKDFSGSGIHRAIGQKYQDWLNENPPQTIGWTDCGCNVGWEAGIAVDPFCGTGTLCAVAKRLGRRYIGIDISPQYCKMAETKLAKTHYQQSFFI